MSAPFSILLLFFFFLLLGAGFSRVLNKRTDNSYGCDISLTGATGFAFLTVLITILIQADIRVPPWVWLILAVISMVLCLLPRCLSISSRNHGNGDPHKALRSDVQDPSKLPEICAVCAVLLAGWGALFFGGPGFHLLRGNGTDSFNYATVALALERLPLWVIQGTEAKTLILQNPVLGLAKVLLTERWATGALLGWCASLSGSPAVHVTFHFGVLCLVLAVGPCYLIARLIGLNPWEAAGLTVAILAGFWAQVVLDMQALSHLHALPISLLLVYLVIKTHDHPWNHWIGNGRLLLILVSCGLVLAYIEFLPFLFLGLTFHHGWRLLCRRVRPVQAMMDVLPILIGCALAFFISPSLLDFLIHQLRYGATGTNTWHQAYFSWLFQYPLAGLWGLTHVDTGRVNASAAPVWHVITGMLGLVLLLAAAAFLVRAARDRGEHQARSLIAALILAGLLQGIVLLSRQQLWAAGKAVSFVYPLLWLGTGCFALTWPHRQASDRKTKIVVRVLRTVAVIWILSQIWLGVARIGIAARQSDYMNYMAHHGSYRQYDGDLLPIVRSLGKPSETPIALITEDSWLGEYASLSLGNQWPIRFASDIKDRVGNALFIPPEALRCRYLLLDRRLSPGLPASPGGHDFPSSKNLILLDIDRDAASRPILAAIRNPHGMESTAGDAPVLWMSGQATTVWIASSSETTALLSGNWQPGPGSPEKSVPTLEAINDEDGASKIQTIDPATTGVALRVRRGVNRFTFRVLEKPARFPVSSEDSRVLPLGFSNPHIEAMKEGTRPGTPLERHP
jgi:hypothetical protein